VRTLKETREGKDIIFKEATISIITDFSIETMRAKNTGIVYAKC
jgi:hypothetical protein